MHGEYKVPGGKLVVVDLANVDGRLHDVQVSGDFFLEPDRALDVINDALLGLPADSSEATLVDAIRDALGDAFGDEATLFGITPEGVAIAVHRALACSDPA
jgi:lipoate-protein ligase A